MGNQQSAIGQPQKTYLAVHRRPALPTDVYGSDDWLTDWLIDYWLI